MRCRQLHPFPHQIKGAFCLHFFGDTFRHILVINTATVQLSCPLLQPKTLSRYDQGLLVFGDTFHHVFGHALKKRNKYQTGSELGFPYLDLRIPPNLDLRIPPNLDLRIPRV